ncbi:HAD hydrolase-like protein [Sphaerisporangium sp. NPDC049002]|uniref:HAD family hydrolase n=1 Tax=Sphaerisporangium sp. NPDC049002 TaxID=3155392 RepID=UPI0033CED8EA
MTHLSDMLVLFDVNGTLMDDTHRAHAATNDVLSSRRIALLSLEEFLDRFRLPLLDFLTDLGVSDSGLALEEWNRGLADREAPARAGAERLLRGLRAAGARVGVVSAAAASAVHGDLDRTGLAPYLDVIVTDADDKIAHLDAHRANHARLVYVGDTEYDIACARTAGYMAIAVTGGYRSESLLQAARPDAIINGLGELPRVLGHEATDVTPYGSAPGTGTGGNGFRF